MLADYIVLGMITLVLIGCIISEVLVRKKLKIQIEKARQQQ